MAKKQRRYYQSEIEKALPKLLGEKLNVILQDGQVHFVKLIQVENKKLVGIDGTDRTHYFPVHLLEEIIVEKHAS